MTSTIESQAVTYSGHGGYEVIAVIMREVHPPQAGEVRIRVAAAAVNPTNILCREPDQGNLPPPLVPGMDAAGIVKAIGLDRRSFGGWRQGHGRSAVRPTGRRGAGRIIRKAI